jgi:CubicO group peptidase (beta-lactamase class C family)
MGAAITVNTCMFEEIWRVADVRVDSGDTPGYVAAVRIKGETAIHAHGEMALGGPPMRTDTLFRIASLTKPIGGALTLLLVEDGVLALDDPVERWVPELPGTATVRHLLTFTSGWGVSMEDTPAGRAMRELGVHPGPLTPDLTGDEFVRRLAQVPRPFAPGDGWLYDTSMDVLSVLLARATGKPVSESLRTRILDPLGMTDTAYFARDLTRLATAYGKGEEVLDPPQGNYAAPPPFEELASGLVSTAEDLLRFFTAMADGALVDTSEMTRDQLTDAQRAMAAPILGEGNSWGYGTGVTAAGAWGWSGGTGTTAAVDPVKDTVAVLLTQRALTGPLDGFDDFYGAVANAA